MLCHCRRKKPKTTPRLIHISSSAFQRHYDINVKGTHSLRDWDLCVATVNNSQQLCTIPVAMLAVYWIEARWRVWHVAQLDFDKKVISAE